MSQTDRYRKQHAEIMALATELGKQLSPERLAADAAEARRLLAEVSGKLIVHLAAEDTVLYPQLLKSKDEQARKVAQRFVAEMGPIAQAFKSYVVRWQSESSIRSDASTFVTETRGIIKALAERIRKENTELYPLADRV